MSGTGGVDANIALQAKAPQVNPLQQIGQFAGAANALNQLKLFPGQQQLQQQAVQGGANSLTQQINQMTAHAMTPLLAQPIGSINHTAVTNQLAIAESMHVPTGNLVAALSQFPTGDGPAFDQAVRAWTLSQSQPAPSAAGAVLPGMTSINQGSGTQPGTVGAPGLPGQGSFTPAGPFVRTYLSPESQAAQVGQIATPAQATALGVPPNTVITVPMVQRLNQQGQGGLIGPQSSASPSMGTGHYPSSPGGPVVTGLAPGQATSTEAQVPPAQAIADRVNQFQTDMFPLKQAQAALQTAPTGMGSEAVHTASSYINTFAPPVIQKALSFISPIMTAQETSAYDEAKKYLTQGQLGAPGATRSNEGLGAAGAANPSTQITKEAAQVVLKGMIALRRMEQDEGQSWLASGQGGQPPDPATFNQFRANFQKQADPRVYMFDQMTPQERQRAIRSSPNPGAFIAAVNRAEQNGVLAPPATQQ